MPPSALRAQDDPRWQAVLNRDPAADGAFVFAVRTTGIYCRPNCPARRANPENVRFYPNTIAAEEAGFRPCRRCRPEWTTPGHPKAARIVDACRLIEEAEQTPDLAALATAAGLTPSHFHRLFKAATGLTPRGYARAHRARAVRAALADGSSVTDALYEAGFGAPSRFYENAPHMLGMAPTRYRKGGAGETIRYTVGQCSLGTILVAASARGICAITLGDDPAALSQDLRNRFPRAHILPDEAALAAQLGEVIAVVDHPSDKVHLPLDIRGTAFQQRVWDALSQIPPGSTATYAGIAQTLGQPNAARAVATACAANPLAVAIPCHRALRTGGALAGYRWGIERKRTLLDREAQPATSTSPGIVTPRRCGDS